MKNSSMAASVFGLTVEQDAQADPILESNVVDFVAERDARLGVGFGSRVTELAITLSPLALGSKQNDLGLITYAGAPELMRQLIDDLADPDLAATATPVDDALPPARVADLSGRRHLKLSLRGYTVHFSVDIAFTELEIHTVFRDEAECDVVLGSLLATPDDRF
jgi:hypothetical protein